MHLSRMSLVYDKCAATSANMLSPGLQNAKTAAGMPVTKHDPQVSRQRNAHKMRSV